MNLRNIISEVFIIVGNARFYNTNNVGAGAFRHVEVVYWDLPLQERRGVFNPKTFYNQLVCLRTSEKLTLPKADIDGLLKVLLDYIGSDPTLSQGQYSRYFAPGRPAPLYQELRSTEAKNNLLRAAETAYNNLRHLDANWTEPFIALIAEHGGYLKENITNALANRPPAPAPAPAKAPPPTPGAAGGVPLPAETGEALQPQQLRLR